MLAPLLQTLTYTMLDKTEEDFNFEDCRRRRASVGDLDFILAGRKRCDMKTGDPASWPPVLLFIRLLNVAEDDESACLEI